MLLSQKGQEGGRLWDPVLDGGHTVWQTVPAWLGSAGNYVSQKPQSSELELAKNGTLVRFGRRTGCSSHSSTKVSAVRRGDGQRQRSARGSSPSSLSPTLHPALPSRPLPRPTDTRWTPPGQQLSRSSALSTHTNASGRLGSDSPVTSNPPIWTFTVPTPPTVGKV